MRGCAVPVALSRLRSLGYAASVVIGVHNATSRGGDDTPHSYLA